MPAASAARRSRRNGMTTTASGEGLPPPVTKISNLSLCDGLFNRRRFRVINSLAAANENERLAQCDHCMSKTALPSGTARFSRKVHDDLLLLEHLINIGDEEWSLSNQCSRPRDRGNAPDAVMLEHCRTLRTIPTTRLSVMII